ncbi:MAG: hypothetical protein V3U76_05225 [Granulosicoccus sp.]
MIIDALTQELLILLAVASLLGAVIGACLWGLLLSRRQNNDSTQFARQERSGTESVNSPAILSPVDQESVAERSLAQAQRIETLEAELLAHEEQQISLRRDLANQKALRRREQPSLFKELDDVEIPDDDSVPVLNKRVDSTSAIHRVAQSGASLAAVSGIEHPYSTELNRELADHLESELELPALAESELPESVDELVFELDDCEDNGIASGG